MGSAVWIFDRIGLWVVLVLSLSIHEWAHAAAASRLGDDTARLAGRLTLNPLSHLDPLGSIALPLLGVPFGWARPVPVEPRRFRSAVPMRRGLALTALAGPVSNLALAGAAAGLRLLVGAHLTAAAGMFLDLTVQLNLALAVFNLLPIPPLDGSRIVEGMGWGRGAAAALRRYGPPALVVLAALLWWLLGG